MSEKQERDRVKDIIEAFVKEYNESMKTLENKYNLKISPGRITYDETGFRFKTECMLRGRNVEEHKENRQAVIGEMVRMLDGKVAVIENIEPRKWKRPYIARMEDGSRVEFDDEYYNKCINKWAGIINEDKDKVWDGKEGFGKTIDDRLMSLCSRMSPERLYADGERTQAQAAQERMRIMNEWREIEKQVGKKIDMERFESYWINNSEKRATRGVERGQDNGR